MNAKFVNFYQHLGIAQHEKRDSARRKVIRALSLNHPDKHVNASPSAMKLISEKTCMLNNAKDIFSSDASLRAWKLKHGRALLTWFGDPRSGLLEPSGFFDPEKYLQEANGDVNCSNGRGQTSSGKQCPTKGPRDQRKHHREGQSNTIRKENFQRSVKRSFRERLERMERDRRLQEALAAEHKRMEQLYKARAEAAVHAEKKRQEHARPRSEKQAMPDFPKDTNSGTNKNKRGRETTSVNAEHGINEVGANDDDGPARRTRSKTWSSHSRPGLYGENLEAQFESIPGYCQSGYGRKQQSVGTDSIVEDFNLAYPERIRTPY